MKAAEVEALERTVKLLRSALELCGKAEQAFATIEAPENDPDAVHMETCYMLHFIHNEIDQMAQSLTAYGHVFGPDQADLFESQEATRGYTTGRPDVSITPDLKGEEHE